MFSVELGIVFNVSFALLLLLGFSRHIAKRLAIINGQSSCLSRSGPLNQGDLMADEIDSLDQAFTTWHFHWYILRKLSSTILQSRLESGGPSHHERWRHDSGEGLAMSAVTESMDDGNAG
jgi:hypothetical protein